MTDRVLPDFSRHLEHARSHDAPPRRQPTALEAEIGRLAASISGRVGVAAWPIGRGAEAAVFNANDTFPMASTFKVALAAAVLAMVDEGKTSLSTLVDVPTSALVPSEVIAGRFLHPGLALSIANLIELTITHSDNTATDVLMDFVGGPAAINEWLSRQNIIGQRVDRNTADLIRGYFGFPAGPVIDHYERLVDMDCSFKAKAMTLNSDWEQDLRDSTTPCAMATLLAAIWSGVALGPSSTAFLLGAMGRCRTGLARLRAQLPKGTAVIDKTGTIGGVANDVGIISLPAGAGDVVVAVFSCLSRDDLADREFMIGAIGRAVYDYYLFTAN